MLLRLVDDVALSPSASECVCAAVVVSLVVSVCVIVSSGGVAGVASSDSLFAVSAGASRVFVASSTGVCVDSSCLLADEGVSLPAELLARDDISLSCSAGVTRLEPGACFKFAVEVG